jgi:hypothetical protein
VIDFPQEVKHRTDKGSAERDGHTLDQFVGGHRANSFRNADRLRIDAGKRHDEADHPCQRDQGIPVCTTFLDNGDPFREFQAHYMRFNKTARTIVIFQFAKTLRHMGFWCGHTGFQIVQTLNRVPYLGRASDQAVHEDSEGADRHKKGHAFEHAIELILHITGKQSAYGHDVQQSAPDNQQI